MTPVVTNLPPEKPIPTIRIDFGGHLIDLTDAEARHLYAELRKMLGVTDFNWRPAQAPSWPSIPFTSSQGSIGPNFRDDIVVTIDDIAVTADAICK